MKYLVFVFIAALMFSSLPTSATTLIDKDVSIRSYDREGLGNSTHPILLWYIHNQSLDGADLVMNARIDVINSSTPVNVNVLFEKMKMTTDLGSKTKISISFAVEIRNLRKGESVELSLMWNQVLNNSRLYLLDNFTHVQYFETMMIWLEKPGFWDQDVDLKVSMWTSINSSKVNNTTPVHLERAIYKSSRSLETRWLFFFTPLLIVLFWRRLK